MNMLSRLLPEIIVTALIIIIICILNRFISTEHTGDEVKYSKKSSLTALVAVLFSVLILNPLSLYIIIKNVHVDYGLIKMLILMGQSLLILSPVIICMICNNEALSDIGITSGKLFKSILYGLISVAIFIIVSIIGENEFQKLQFWAVIDNIIVAITEEIMFRGYIQSRLMSWIGDFRGFIATVIFFSLVHIPQRIIVNHFSFNQALQSSLCLIPIALVLSFLFYKTKNISGSIIFHAAYNSLLI